MEFMFNLPRRLATAALAGTLALGLAACNQKPDAGKAADSGAAPKTEQAAAAVQQQVEQAKAAVAETAATAGQAVDDAALTARVKAALIAEPSIKALAIDVETKDGVVTLFGTADTLASRNTATQVAAGVSGVKTVLNNLKIISGS